MEVHLQKRLRGGKGSFDLNVSFDIVSGSILAIMGASGVGKTSVLKMIAGLLSPDRGTVTVSGQSWFDSQQRIDIRTQDRSIGYVFQEYALFPNMSVRKNLQYALPPRQSTNVVDEVLELMHIQNLAEQKPTMLSGGQQQRVALARAIVRQPQVLLLDEPFAALDERMRGKLQNDLIALHHRYQTTTLLVSHNPAEVARMADKVLLLHDGKIAKYGGPSSVLANDSGTLLEGEVLAVEGNYVTIVIKNSLSTLFIDNATTRYKIGDTFYLNSDQHQIQPKGE